MEYSRILVDTSIFVEYLRNKKKEKTILFNIPNETYASIRCFHKIALEY